VHREEDNRCVIDGVFNILYSIFELHFKYINYILNTSNILQANTSNYVRNTSNILQTKINNTLNILDVLLVSNNDQACSTSNLIQSRTSNIECSMLKTFVHREEDNRCVIDRERGMVYIVYREEN